MARRDTVREALAGIAAVAADPRSSDGLAVLRRALGGRVGIVVAAAARVVRDASVDGLVDLLAQAFERLLTDPIKRDPQCRGKLAIVEALVHLDVDARAVFELGVCHQQLEPVWGGTEDSAGPLRGTCAQGLAGSTDSAVLVPIAELLVDPEPSARIGAIRALVRHGDVAAGVPLLRLKLKGGDSEAAVIGECVAALLQLDAERSLRLVGRLLDTPPTELADAAALALGEARPAGAFELLRDRVESPHTVASTRALLLALSMLRTARAWSCLIEIVATAPEHAAAEALQALALHREAVEADLGEQIREVVRARASKRLDAALAGSFG